MKGRPFDDRPEEDALEQEAMAWLCERDAGFAPGRAEAFARWCAADPQHARAVGEAEATFAFVAAELPAVAGEVEARAPTLSRVTVFPIRQVLAWAGGLAAAVVLAVLWPDRSTDVFNQEVATNAGEPRFVALADGSGVDLKAHSRVQVQLTAAERRIVLTNGEAHFVVAPDATRPFVVHAGGVTVRAVGTAFNVAMTPEGVEVVVTEGKVAVDGAHAATRMMDAGPVIAAGQRAWVDAKSLAPVVERMAPPQLNQKLAWRKRLESFPDVALWDLVQRFNRVNLTQLAIEGAELAGHRVGGTFALGEVDAFVAMLEREGDIVAERRPGNLIVLRPAR